MSVHTPRRRAPRASKAAAASPPRCAAPAPGGSASRSRRCRRRTPMPWARTAAASPAACAAPPSTTGRARRSGRRWCARCERCGDRRGASARHRNRNVSVVAGAMPCAVAGRAAHGSTGAQEGGAHVTLFFILNRKPQRSSPRAVRLQEGRTYFAARDLLWSAARVSASSAFFLRRACAASAPE